MYNYQFLVILGMQVNCGTYVHTYICRFIGGIRTRDQSLYYSNRSQRALHIVVRSYGYQSDAEQACMLEWMCCLDNVAVSIHTYIPMYVCTYRVQNPREKKYFIDVSIIDFEIFLIARLTIETRALANFNRLLMLLKNVVRKFLMPVIRLS
jgi:hypothetical protein